MDRSRRRLCAELFSLGLVLACTVGISALVISIYRRPAKVEAPAVVLAPAPEPEPPAVPKPVATAPPAPPQDPTVPILADLRKAETAESTESKRADARASSLETATKKARTEADKAKRQAALLRSRLNALLAQTREEESRAELASIERDVLAKRRDVLKKTLQHDVVRPNYAVLPHKGQNGTWQRPIVIECKNGETSIRPKGPAFSLLDITSPYGMRSNPFVAAVSREAIRVQRQSSPDGEPVTPYIFFIVRSDGIRPYYEARARLERLGVAFGYELADADWAVDVPDLDQPSAWDGSPTPIDLAASGGDSLVGGTGKGDADNPFIWPKHPPGLESGRESGTRSGTPPTSLGVGGDSWDRTWNRALRPDVADRPIGFSPTPLPDENPRLRGQGSALREMGGSRRPVSSDGSQVGNGFVSDLPSEGMSVEGSNEPSGRLEDGSRLVFGSSSGASDKGSHDPSGRSGGGSGLGSSSGALSEGPTGSAGAGFPSSGRSRPIELVLACGRQGVVVHPGDYRVTIASLKANDRLLVAQLKAVVQNRNKRYPGDVIAPSIRFVIQPGGTENYATARGQLAVAGLDWPTSFEVSGGDILRVFSTDGW